MKNYSTKRNNSPSDLIYYKCSCQTVLIAQHQSQAGPRRWLNRNQEQCHAEDRAQFQMLGLNMAGLLVGLIEDILGGVDIVKCIDLPPGINHREPLHPPLQRLMLAAEGTGVEQVAIVQILSCPVDL